MTAVRVDWAIIPVGTANMVNGPGDKEEARRGLDGPRRGVEVF